MMHPESVSQPVTSRSSLLSASSIERLFTLAHENMKLMRTKKQQQTQQTFAAATASSNAAAAGGVSDAQLEWRVYSSRAAWEWHQRAFDRALQLYEEAATGLFRREQQAMRLQVMPTCRLLHDKALEMQQMIADRDEASMHAIRWIKLVSALAERT